MEESKRKEIKEWINKYLTEQFISGSGDTPSYECIRESDKILEYLDSQGVVIQNEDMAIFHHGYFPTIEKLIDKDLKANNGN